MPMGPVLQQQVPAQPPPGPHLSRRRHTTQAPCNHNAKRPRDRYRPRGLVRALGRIRTCDTGFRRAVLYPLSYEGGGLSRTLSETPLGPPDADGQTSWSACVRMRSGQRPRGHFPGHTPGSRLTADSLADQAGRGRLDCRAPRPRPSRGLWPARFGDVACAAPLSGRWGRWPRCFRMSVSRPGWLWSAVDPGHE